MRQYVKTIFAGAVLVGSVSVSAMDLLEAWRATRLHDPQASVSQAARLAGAARREQAASLWRPSVQLSATAGIANSEMSMSGAHFSAPGFGQSDGVGFDTSVNNGHSTRWSVSARQAIWSPERKAQGHQLEVAADVAELEWQVAEQDLMLVTAQRYFNALLAQRKVALLQQQQEAVNLALVEAKDRFAVGDKPITDTHEASARAHALQAQVLVARDQLELALSVLTDATGVANPVLDKLPLDAEVLSASLPPLPQWIERALERNPRLAMQAGSLQVTQQEVTKYSATAAATLDLVAHAGRDSLSGGGSFGSASNTSSQQMIGLQLSIPLYTGGYRSAKQSEALRLQDKASAELESQRQQITQQTRAVWLGLQTARGRLEALTSARVASLARLDATRLGRQVGDRTTLELLQAQNDASGAELALLEARIEFLLDRLKLQALVGELNENHLDAVNRLLQR